MNGVKRLTTYPTTYCGYGDGATTLTPCPAGSNNYAIGPALPAQTLGKASDESFSMSYGGAPATLFVARVTNSTQISAFGFSAEQPDTDLWANFVAPKPDAADRRVSVEYYTQVHSIGIDIKFGSVPVATISVLPLIE